MVSDVMPVHVFTVFRPVRSAHGVQLADGQQRGHSGRLHSGVRVHVLPDGLRQESRETNGVQEARGRRLRHEAPDLVVGRGGQSHGRSVKWLEWLKKKEKRKIQ